MKTTVLAIALMFTVAIAANASTASTTMNNKIENAAISSTKTMAKTAKAKKAHHKKQGKSHAAKKSNK